MKWILSFVLLICLQVRAEEVAVNAVNPPAEITAAAPAQEAAAEVSTKNLKETEIPVNLEAAKKSSSNEHPIFKMLISFCIVGLMGCAAYYLIRKYRYANPKAEATQIKVLSQHYLGPKKSLAIVRVAGESVLIGITDHNISMIKSLSLLDEDIPEEAPKDFTTIFSKKTKMESSSAASMSSDEPENKDDFSISGIKDFVSVKLKNMRSIE